MQKQGQELKSVCLENLADNGLSYSFNYLRNKESFKSIKEQKLEFELLQFYNDVVVIGNFDQKKLFLQLSDLFKKHAGSH